MLFRELRRSDYPLFFYALKRLNYWTCVNADIEYDASKVYEEAVNWISSGIPIYVAEGENDEIAAILAFETEEKRVVLKVNYRYEPYYEKLKELVLFVVDKSRELKWDSVTALAPSTQARDSKAPVGYYPSGTDAKEVAHIAIDNFDKALETCGFEKIGESQKDLSSLGIWRKSL